MLLLHTADARGYHFCLICISIGTEILHRFLHIVCGNYAINMNFRRVYCIRAAILCLDQETVLVHLSATILTYLLINSDLVLRISIETVAQSCSNTVQFPIQFIEKHLRLFFKRV